MRNIRERACGKEAKPLESSFFFLFDSVVLTSTSGATRLPAGSGEELSLPALIPESGRKKAIFLYIYGFFNLRLIAPLVMVRKRYERKSIRAKLFFPRL